MTRIWISQAWKHNLLCSSAPFFLITPRENEIWILYISHSKSEKKGKDEADLVFTRFSHSQTWRRWTCVYWCGRMSMDWGTTNSLTSKSLCCAMSKTSFRPLADNITNHSCLLAIYSDSSCLTSLSFVAWLVDSSLDRLLYSFILPIHFFSLKS